MSTLERIITRIVTAAYGFKHGERGQGMAEYGLILALVAVVVITAITTLGSNISGTFNTITGAI